MKTIYVYKDLSLTSQKIVVLILKIYLFKEFSILLADKNGFAVIPRP